MLQLRGFTGGFESCSSSGDVFYTQQFGAVCSHLWIVCIAFSLCLKVTVACFNPHLCKRLVELCIAAAQPQPGNDPVEGEACSLYCSHVAQGTNADRYHYPRQALMNRNCLFNGVSYD